MSVTEKVLLGLAVVFIGASFGRASELSAIHLTLAAIFFVLIATAIR